MRVIPRVRPTGSPPPVRVWVTEATSAPPVSLVIQASTVNGETHTHTHMSTHTHTSMY